MIENGILLNNNPYGYRVNVNHSRINELYRRYKAWKGLPCNMPLTDEQRKDFEKYIFEKLTPRQNKK